jgi:hypothetical protein
MIITERFDLGNDIKSVEKLKQTALEESNNGTQKSQSNTKQHSIEI